MTYVDTYRSRNRTATITVVAGLHALLGYALVTGLAAHFVPKDPPKMQPIDFPLPKPLPSPPPKPDERQRTPLDPPITVIDRPIPMPQPTFTVSPQPLPSAEPTQIATVLFPTPSASASPTPPPPRFKPKPAEPIGNPANWVSPSDYPTTDLRRGNQGVTRFRLSIGTDGRVTGCTVTGTSGFATLDAAACAKLTARGRFRAATGEDGEKVAGSYASSILWEIPEE